MTISQPPPLHVQLAKVSWVAPLLFVGANFLLRQVEKSDSSGVLAVTTSVLAALLALTGLISGVMAVTGVRKHGTKGILIPSIVGMLVSSAFLVVIVTNFWSAYTSAKDPQRQIEAAARRMKASLPMKVDTDTELTAVTAEPGQLVYDYRLVSHTKDQIDAPAFQAALAPEIKDRLCPQLQFLWKNRLTCRVRYSSSDAAPLAEVVLTADDCAELTPRSS